MKILLLDDDVRDVPAMVELWRLHGHTVTQVTEIADLRDILQKEPFDCALIDLMIPAVEIPLSDCNGGFTTGEYLYRTYIHPVLGDKPFCIFSSAVFNLDLIKDAVRRLSKFPGYRGCFKKGDETKDLLEAIAK